MKVAALQLDADFANVQVNLEKVEEYIIQAADQGVELLVLPEFFTSAIGYSEKMFEVIQHNSVVPSLLTKLSADYNIIIGGSTLQFNGENIYNVFQLFFPDGQAFSHSKDMPTQLESCYYTKGDKNNVLNTSIGDFGVALCWEMLRYDTVKRMAGKINLILAGSCWWDLTKNALVERVALRKYNQNLAIETPVTFAKLLNTPVIHGNHCGEVSTMSFPDNKYHQTRQYVGAAQIVDADGTIIARRSFDEGEGLVFAELEVNKDKKATTKIDTNKFWIPDLPDEYIRAWERNNALGEEYYKNTALPTYKKSFGKAP